MSAFFEAFPCTLRVPQSGFMSSESGGLSPGVVVLQLRQALTSLGDQSSGNVQFHSQPVPLKHWLR